MSGATQPSEAEIHATLQRALDKIEEQSKLIVAQNAALSSASTVIERQDKEKSDLESVIVYKDRTIAAKDQALAAERDANVGLHKESELKDKRIEQVTKERDSAKKRNKFAFFLGVIAGAVGAHAIGL